MPTACTSASTTAARRARARVGPSRIVGTSCYDSLARSRASRSTRAPSRLAFGSFFPSGTKPNARHASVDIVPLARTLGVPIVAIGGIDAANARTLAEAGVDAVAVIAAVFAHDDPRDVVAAARAIAGAFSKQETER
jgi:thiamine-phosphate pyrophosphorylase